MWLKILTLLALFCLWPIVGLAQLPKDPLAQETLRGLPGVRLIVEKIDAEVERDGLTTKAIARRSGLSHEAIDCRFRRLNAKLGAASRTDAARIAAQYGLL